MLVPYDALTDEAKMFIFPGNRKLFPEELPEIIDKINSFCESFKGIDLFFELKYGRFLIFIVSEQTPLDLDGQNRLVEFVRELEDKYNVVFMDKVNVSFKQGAYVQMKEIPDFKALIKNSGVSRKTIVFDHMINSKYEYDNYWEVPAGESWLAHFFK